MNPNLARLLMSRMHGGGRHAAVGQNGVLMAAPNGQQVAQVFPFVPMGPAGQPVGYGNPYGGPYPQGWGCGPEYGNIGNCGPSFNRDRLGCCPPELLPYLQSPFFSGPKCKDQFLSGRLALDAGETDTLSITPVVPFCVERVTVPSFLGPFFDINTFLIGNEPQTAGGGPTNASVFSEGAADSVLKGDCVFPAVPIQLSVTNTSAIARVFQITLFGKSVD